MALQLRRLDVTSDDVKSAVMLAALAVGGYAAWQAWRKAQGLADSVAGAAGDAIDAVTGAAKSVSDTVGHAWDAGSEVAQHAGVSAWQLATPGTAIGGLIGGTIRNNPNLINPASSDNLVNRGVNALGGYIAGENDWSLGGWIYENTN